MIVLCCTHFTQIFVCTHCLCPFGSINEMVYILKKVALLSMYNLIYNDITWYNYLTVIKPNLTKIFTSTIKFKFKNFNSKILILILGRRKHRDKDIFSLIY